MTFRRALILTLASELALALCVLLGYLIYTLRADTSPWATIVGSTVVLNANGALETVFDARGTAYNVTMLLFRILHPITYISAGLSMVAILRRPQGRQPEVQHRLMWAAVTSIPIFFALRVLATLLFYGGY